MPLLDRAEFQELAATLMRVAHAEPAGLDGHERAQALVVAGVMSLFASRISRTEIIELAATLIDECEPRARAGRAS